MKPSHTVVAATLTHISRAAPAAPNGGRAAARGLEGPSAPRTRGEDRRWRGANKLCGRCPGGCAARLAGKVRRWARVDAREAEAADRDGCSARELEVPRREGRDDDAGSRNKRRVRSTQGRAPCGVELVLIATREPRRRKHIRQGGDADHVPRRKILVEQRRPGERLQADDVKVDANGRCSHQSARMRVRPNTHAHVRAHIGAEVAACVRQARICHPFVCVARRAHGCRYMI